MNKIIMINLIKTIFHYRILFISVAFTAAGVLMTLWQLIEFFIIKDDISIFGCGKIVIGILIIVISLIYAYYSLFYEKSKIELEINKRTKLLIHQGDLMRSPGMRVIPVNEYFDTHKGDGIINPSSLHGQFISLFEGRIHELKQQIENQLSQKDSLPSLRVRNMVEGLPQTRYPLGTCIRINDNGQSYMLVAITRFNSNEHVDVATEEYPEVIRKMYNGVEQLNDGNAVYMPLVGSGISGYQLTNMQLLNTIVQMAHNSDKLAVTNGIHVTIYDEKQLKTLNLNIIEYLYKRWRTLK